MIAIPFPIFIAVSIVLCMGFISRQIKMLREGLMNMIVSSIVLMLIFTFATMKLSDRYNKDFNELMIVCCLAASVLIPMLFSYIFL